MEMIAEKAAQQLKNAKYASAYMFKTGLKTIMKGCAGNTIIQKGDIK